MLARLDYSALPCDNVHPLHPRTDMDVNGHKITELAEGSNMNN